VAFEKRILLSNMEKEMVLSQWYGWCALLQQQYYKEKIQENKEIPTIEILDEAIPPKKSVAPKIVYSSIVGAIFFVILLSFVFILRDKKFYYNVTKKS